MSMQSSSTSAFLPSDVESRRTAAEKSRQSRHMANLKEAERKENLDKLIKCNTKYKMQFNKQKQSNENLEMECEFLKTIIRNQDYIDDFVKKLNIHRISIKVSDVIKSLLNEDSAHFCNLLQEQSEIDDNIVTSSMKSISLNPSTITFLDNFISGTDSQFLNDDHFNLSYHTPAASIWSDQNYDVCSSENADQYYMPDLNPLASCSYESDAQLTNRDLMDTDWLDELFLPDDANDVFAD